MRALRACVRELLTAAGAAPLLPGRGDVARGAQAVADQQEWQLHTLTDAELQSRAKVGPAEDSRRLLPANILMIVPAPLRSPTASGVFLMHPVSYLPRTACPHMPCS